MTELIPNGKGTNVREDINAEFTRIETEFDTFQESLNGFQVDLSALQDSLKNSLSIPIMTSINTVYPTDPIKDNIVYNSVTGYFEMYIGSAWTPIKSPVEKSNTLNIPLLRNGVYPASSKDGDIVFNVLKDRFEIYEYVGIGEASMIPILTSSSHDGYTVTSENLRNGNGYFIFDGNDDNRAQFTSGSTLPSAIYIDVPTPIQVTKFYTVSSGGTLNDLVGLAGSNDNGKTWDSLGYTLAGSGGSVWKTVENNTNAYSKFKITGGDCTGSDDPIHYMQIHDILLYGNVPKYEWKPASTNYEVVKAVSAAYTLTSDDNGANIVVDSASEVTITVPDTLSIGFSCSVRQLGLGQVTLAGSGNMTVHNSNGYTKTAKQYAVLGIQVVTSSVVILDGEGA